MSWLQDYLSQSNKAWDEENQRIGDSYVPDEHTNFIDSFQSNVWGSLSGYAGFLAAGAEKAGFTGLRDWAENEASYAGKRAYANADKTEYDDLGWYDPRYYINGHALNATAQMLGGSLVDIGLVAGSLLSAPETGGASLAGIAAVGAARTGGRIMGEKLLGNVLTKYALEKGATMGLEAGAKLASRQVLGEAALGTAKGLVNDIPFILTKGASESAINAGDVYMESLQMGNDRDTASSQSMQAFGEGYIPAMAEFYADKMAIGGTLAGFATKGGKVLSKAVRSAVANGVVSGQMEGAVEAWQTMVQDRALGKEDALNARIYDPTSWSDNMADAYGQAVGPAMLLGGIGGARAGISSAMNNPNPNVKVTPEVAEQPVSIEGDITPVTDSITPIEEGVAPIEGEISSAPVVDLGGMDSTSPRQGLYDEMRNTFIRNNPKSPDIVETKSQATNDKIEDIVSLWDNSSPEEIQNLAPNTFVEDFKQAGLTDAEAGRASNGLVKHMKEQKPLPKIDGKALIEEASKVGVQLDPKQAENLVSDNPSPALVKQVQNKINKVRPIVEKQQAKLDKKREQEAIAKQQKEYLENEKRNYVNNNYENSTNKQFFDRVIGNTENEPNKVAETAYKFKRAMKERNKDIKNEKPKAKNVRNYLTKQGITEEKYGKTPVQAMVDYAKSMDQERINARQSARTSDEYRSSLKESARNVTNVMAVDKMHDDAFNNAHGDQIKSVERDIDNSLIQLGQNGFDITKLKHYKRLENAAKGFHKQAIDRLQRINESVGLAEKVKPVENTPIETKTIEGNKPVEEAKPIEEKPPVEEKPAKPKRTRTNKPKTYKGHTEARQFFSGEKSISDTVTTLNQMEKDETLKPKEREEVANIRKLLNNVRDEEGNLEQKELTETGNTEYNNIMKEHKDLKDKAKANNIGIQEFTKQADSLKRRAEKLFRSFPNAKTLDLVVGSNLVFKVPSQNAIAKAIREDVVKPNRTLINTFMSKPGNFNDAVLGFVESAFGSKLSTLPTNIRNAVVEKILQNEYNNLIKKYGDNEGILKANPSNLKQLAARIAGSFPTQDFPSIGKEAAESTTAIFGERSKGLANIANDNQGMIGLAREYYQKEEEKIKPKEKVEPKARTTKHQTKAGYTVNKEGVKASISIGYNEDEYYPITITVKFDNPELSTDQNIQDIIGEIYSDLFFDADDIDVVSNENGVAELTARPVLSYTNMSNKVSQEGILKAREEAIKAAIGISPDKEVAFVVDANADISALQDVLNKIYGEDKYKVKTEVVSDRKNIYIMKEESPVNDEIKGRIIDNSLFSTGSSSADNSNVPNKEIYNQDNMERHEGENRNFSKNISLELIPKIKQAIVDYLGDAELLEKIFRESPHLLIRFRLFEDNPKLMGLHVYERGTIDFKYNQNDIEENIRNGVPIHELVHELVSNLEVKEKGKGKNNVVEKHKFVNRLINHVINSVLEDLYENDNGRTLAELGLSRGRYTRNVGGIGKTSEYREGRRNSDSGSGVSSPSKGEGTRIQLSSRLLVKSEKSSPRNGGRSGVDIYLDDSDVKEATGSLEMIKNSIFDGMKDDDWVAITRTAQVFIKDVIGAKAQDGENLHPQKKINLVISYLAGLRKISQEAFNRVLTDYEIRQEILGYGSMSGFISQSELQNLANISLSELKKNGDLRLREQTEFIEKGGKDRQGNASTNRNPDSNDMQSNPAEASVNMAEKLIEKEIKKETDRIEVHRRADNKDNIPMYALLKEVRSPSSLSRKHFPELVKFIKEAQQVARKTDRDLKKYRAKMDAVYKQLKNEDSQKSFEKLKVEISDRRMEFAQVIPITMQDGTNKYTIIKEGDIFEEFEDESDALQKKVELENAGYKVAKDYKNQRHRIFASKDMVRGYNSLEQANQIAIKESGEIAKSKGYNDTVWKAYVEYRKTLDELMIKAANANERIGNPDKQKYSWGYSPFEHSRFGVYEEQKGTDENGKETVTRNVIASFRTEKAARKWVEKNLLNNPQFAQSKFAIVEQERNYNNPRNDFDSHYSTIDNDYFKDHVVEDYMTAEQKEAEFKRLTGLYPEMKKLVDSGFINKPLTQQEFLNLVNDKATMEKIGIDAKALQNEMKHANGFELFKRNGKVTKKSLIEHFYTNTGDFAKNKHNMTRVMGAKGSNPNLQRADYDYIVSMVKHINNAEWYHKATTAYEHWFKDKYKANRSTGSMSNKQEMMHTLIRTVMGVPNHFDTRLNEVMNEIPGLGSFMTKNYGETWFTDLMKRGMEVTALVKLGLLRPTAMIAQLGVMANIFTMTGFNQNFWAAQEEALKGNKNPKYKDLFSYIGIGEDYQGVESDVFNDSKSIVHTTKIGKLLAKAMLPFEVGDNFTRRVAAIYAYEKALAQGKTKEEAMSIANDFTYMTNFDYTEIDSPGIFQRAGVVGKMLLQFKKYPVKQIEFIHDICNLMDLPENPSVADIEKAKKERKMRLIRFMGSYVAMAGMLGMPMVGAVDELAAWIMGTKPTEAVKELMYEWAGKDPVKQALARGAIYGVPGMAGVDFTRNIGLGDVIPSDASELAGPTFGTIASMYNAFKYDQSPGNKILAEVHAIAPFYTNLYQALGTGKMRDWKAGMDTRPYTPMERTLKALGFRSIRESTDSDLANILYNKIKETKDAKKASIYKYLDNPSAENLKNMV